MRKVTRRDFVKGSLAAGLALGMPGLARSASPNGDVRLAIIGLGGIDVPGSVGGRGRQLLKSCLKVPGVKVVALCDPDKAILEHGAALFKDEIGTVKCCTDLRAVLEDKDVDAVIVATPDHWHALATVWACQAGKDVYVEKPLSYNIWEGRQIVAAAKKYGRIVQVGTQARSALGLQEAFEFIRSGQLGKIQYGHVVVYRKRESIGKVKAPTAIPPTVDYNLWCGPAPLAPLKRTWLHYDWHWVWPTGTGEIGNNGVHSIDMCRWAMGLDAHPRRAMSIGGRFGYDDDGETPNTNIVLLDYGATPVICELRALPMKKGAEKVDTFRGLTQGVLVQCEGGYFTGTHPGGTAFDNQGKAIKAFTNPKSPTPEVMHLANFVEAVRSRDAGKLHAPALAGHMSVACGHMANISWRLGAAATPEAIAEATRGNKEFADAFARYREHLKANGIDLGVTQSRLGPWVTLDPESERFTGDFAEQANALAMRSYRQPFVVPAVS